MDRSTQWDTIIIGAGAAGLSCGVKLAQAGQRVLILEARDRPGGRIWTFAEPNSQIYIEAGAEFIHGNLPFTFQWLHQAGLKAIPVEGKQVRIGAISHRTSTTANHWQQFYEQLSHLQHDMPLLAFLDKFFPAPAYHDFRKQVLRFAIGYDAADPQKVSVQALAQEWQTEEGPNYRIESSSHKASLGFGYGAFINTMQQAYEQAGGKLIFRHQVKQMDFSSPTYAQIKTESPVGPASFEARSIVCTLPPGIFQHSSSAAPQVVPTSALPDLMQRLGFGNSIKIVFIWQNAWWTDIWGPDLGFIFAETDIPTWWTAYPQPWPVLTGWLSGKNSSRPSKSLLNQAFSSLSAISRMPPEKLRKISTKYYIFDWFRDPFACGSYGYPVPQLNPILQNLQQLFPQRLYFAGESYVSRPPWGTVESAIRSGQEVAECILKQSFTNFE